MTGDVFSTADLDALGRVIRLLRERAGLSQRQLATLAGIGLKTLSLAESGRTSPSLLTAHKIAQALGTTVERLVEDARTRAPGAVFTPQKDGAADLTEGLAEPRMTARLVPLDESLALGTSDTFAFVLSGRVRLVEGDPHAPDGTQDLGTDDGLHATGAVVQLTGEGARVLTVAKTETGR